MAKKTRYETVFFISKSGVGIEGHVIGKKHGWLTIKTVFTDNIVKRRNSEVYTVQEYQEALRKVLYADKTKD